MLANHSTSVRSFLVFAFGIWMVGSCDGSGPGNGAQGSGGSTANPGSDGANPGSGGLAGGGRAGAGAAAPARPGSGGATGSTGGGMDPGGSTPSGSGATGGSVVTGAGGVAGIAGSDGSGAGNTGGSSGAGGVNRGAGGSGGSAVTFNADRVVVTGVRSTLIPPATSTITLHNGGQTSVQITGLSLGPTEQLLLGAMPVG